MRFALVVTMALTLAVALMSGCETTEPEKADLSQDASLEEYGGYTLEDEAPAFGDAEILSRYPDDEPYDDGMADHPDVTRAQNREGAKHYALRIVWGNLEPPDSTTVAGEGCPVSDWSGSVSIDGGVVIVRRVVRFDREDSITRPRSNAHQVQWVSYTKDHLDGIVLHVIDVPGRGASDSTNSITITTPYYSAEILLESLSDYHELVTYDDCNKISVVAVEFNPRCPRGFMEGGWVVETDTSGYFMGVWIGDFGGIAGHLRGNWIHLSDGTRQLYGKWIDTAGSFEGLLRGTWSPLEAARGPDGSFHGAWVDEDLVVRGFFRGHYCMSLDGGDGFFHGRWTKDCRQ
jgi:hypothetical protein